MPRVPTLTERLCSMSSWMGKKNFIGPEPPHLLIRCLYSRKWRENLGHSGSEIQKICGNIYDSVFNTTAGKAAEKYWEVNKQRFGSCSAKDVDWDATEKAMKAQPRSRQQWITKHTTGFCAVGKMMLRRKEWPNSECPRCKATEETTAHIWKCPHLEATALWEKSLKKFMLWMLTQQTPLALAKIICDRLLAWRSDTEPTLKAPSLPVWGAALELQDKMGWQSFFEGTPAVGWSKFMDRHYNSRRSNKKWTQMVVCYHQKAVEHRLGHVGKPEWYSSRQAGWHDSSQTTTGGQK